MSVRIISPTCDHRYLSGQVEAAKTLCPTILPCLTVKVDNNMVFSRRTHYSKLFSDLSKAESLSQDNIYVILMINMRDWMENPSSTVTQDACICDTHIKNIHIII